MNNLILREVLHPVHNVLRVPKQLPGVIQGPSVHLKVPNTIIKGNPGSFGSLEGT